MSAESSSVKTAKVNPINQHFRVKVTEIVSSRFPQNLRPDSWDARVSGTDVVKSEDGSTFKLYSDGQQSPPQVGQVIMITGGDNNSGYSWTLYGITPSYN